MSVCSKTVLQRRLIRQWGFSLVELMVAMAVGLMVIAALMAAFFAASVSNAHVKAQTQISEDANAAMSVLRMQLASVGYSRPVAAGGNSFTRAYAGAGLKACDGLSFLNPGDEISLLNCAGAAGSDALALAYEADSGNSVLSGGVPLDCLGNTLTQVAGPPAYYLAYSRFYLDRPAGGRKALYCRGRAAGAQALVENVEDLQFLFGVAAPQTVPPTFPRQVAYYANAGELAGDFTNVVSIRMCVVVASAEQVLDSITNYRNCVQAEVTPTDRRMYRAFTSTVVLPNRIGPLQ